MKPGLNHDHFEVINGPEDGSLFPLMRSPVDIGTIGQCGVLIQFDRDVGAVHARVTVASDGYRIRSLEGCRIEVNGKRVGGLRSRYLRPGDVVRVGQTQLALYCADEGLARRSKGIKSESDVRWAFHLLRQKILKLMGATSEKYL